MKKRTLLLLLLLCVAISLSGCALIRRLPPLGGLIPDPTDKPIRGPYIEPLPLPGDIVSLSFSESHSYHTRVQGYDYREEDGKHTAYFWLANEYDPYPVPVEDVWVDQLQDIVQAYNVILWDGFKGSDSMLLDGDSFSFSLAFSDGTTVNASGYGSFPSGYGDASAEIKEHFMQLLPEDMRTW